MDMKKFVFAILFLFAVSCATVEGANGPRGLVGEPPGHVLNCAEALTLIDVRDDDAPLMRSYTREACEVSKGEKILLATAEIKVIAMPFDEVINWCSGGKGGALACTMKHPSREGAYTIFIPHGAPGIMMHEVLHIILWEQKVPSFMHHAIMQQKGWYWVDRQSDAAPHDH